MYSLTATSPSIQTSRAKTKTSTLTTAYSASPRASLPLHPTLRLLMTSFLKVKNSSLSPLQDSRPQPPSLITTFQLISPLNSSQFQEIQLQKEQMSPSFLNILSIRRHPLSKSFKAISAQKLRIFLQTISSPLQA